METNPATEELIVFFKALADANRLKIIGLLATQPQTVEALAAQLELSPSTVSHHLTRLAETGLVYARAEGYYSLYHLDEKVLEEKAQRILSRESLPNLAAGVDTNAFDHKVIHDYCLPDGSFTTIPSQRKKLDAILRYVVQAFEFGQRYPEKQVNERLACYNPDTATLRRELIGNKLMERKNGEYWRVEDAI